RGGARILGLGDETGTLEVGKKADLFVVDMMRPHLVPTLRIVSSFVHNGQPADITSVMVDGKWVMRDGKVLTVDEADIVRQAEKIGHSVWRRLLDRYPNVPFPVTIPSKG
ncbi:MAG: amidohydrolase family protein, partial [Chloroflexi bacterium]|nr:amidohydrolase family protein [Chloroflexota bacterium]